jgi:hypothetical protein
MRCGQDGVSFVFMRRSAGKFCGTGMSEVGGISGAERAQTPRFGQIDQWRQ